MGKRNKGPGRVYEKLTKEILTKENWYPNLPGDKLRVSFMELMRNFKQAKPQLWRVCVWGNDDFGMERDYPDRTDAKKAFQEIVDFTTKEELRILFGFWGA